MPKIIKMPPRLLDSVVLSGRRSRDFAPSHYRRSTEMEASTEEDDVAVQRARLETARSQAERIVSEAQIQAAALMREAQARGYADGRAEGLRMAEEQCKEHLDRLAELGKNALVDRDTMVRSAERELASLAVAIAAKLIRREISGDPSLVLSMVESALDKVGPTESIRIVVHPEDADLVKRSWPELRGTIAFGRDWEVVGDDRMERGGCLLETRGGKVDSRIETQLAEIADAFEVGP